MNTEAITRENFHRCVVVTFGGTIALLMYKQNQFELSFQNQKPRSNNGSFYADFLETKVCNFETGSPIKPTGPREKN
jgi:hypothetical protein